MANVGTVIVTWNSRRFVRDCLVSIPTHYHSRTIVIDNDSNDDTARIVRTEFPAVRLQVNAANLGYAQANNQGLKALTAQTPRPDYLLLLNPDARLPPGGVERMADYLGQHPEVGMLAPRLVNPDGTAQASVRRLPTYRNMLSALLGVQAAYRIKGFNYDAIQEVEQPMASCLLIRRQVLDQVGLFDEQFPMFLNDVDLSRRVRDAGWKTVYYPEVAVWHYLGGSTEQRRVKMILLAHQALFRYFRKYDQSGWFRLKAVPVVLVIELAALMRIIFRRQDRKTRARDAKSKE